jgi:CTP synthase
MQQEQLDVIVLKKLNITWYPEPDLTVWKGFLEKLSNPTATVTIGLIGKYIELQDAYKSILEAFIHAGAMNQCKVEVVDIHSEFIAEDNVHEKLQGLNGLLVAPGFGHRGIEGKILAVKYARENGLPFFGICLGMQMSVIEFARNVLGLKGAHSTEMDPQSADPVIDLMEGQKTITSKGGTMRLGAYPCKLEPGTLAHKIYDADMISERHRHRWEFNNKYLDAMQAAGLKASGVNPETNLVEIVEIPSHPFFIGVQYHPELKSTVENPHPIFVHFVKAALDFQNNRVNGDKSLAPEMV